MQEHPNKQLTDDEAALYDRGIRLWGVDAQMKLRQSKILFIGINGLMSEIIKNVVLAGVDAIALIDNHIVTSSDLSSHLFLTSESIGKSRSKEAVSRISELNPLVKVQVIEKDIGSIHNELIQEYSIICVSGQSFSDILKINNLARLHNKLFIATDTFGQYGYSFSDLNDFTYILKKTNDKTEEVTFKEVNEIYHPLNQVFQFDWKDFNMNRTPLLLFILSIFYQYETHHLKSVSKSTNLDELMKYTGNNEKLNNLLKIITKNIGNEVAPICAVIGGVVGAEIIKIISKNNEVINNFFFYDSVSGNGGKTEFIKGKEVL